MMELRNDNKAELIICNYRINVTVPLSVCCNPVKSLRLINQT